MHQVFISYGMQLLYGKCSRNLEMAILLQMRQERGTRGLCDRGDATQCELISAVRSMIVQKKKPRRVRGQVQGGNRPTLWGMSR
jgi:hypothetical protein